MIHVYSCMAMGHWDLLTSTSTPPPQGLYEYVKPAWQTKPHPKLDEEKVKRFGQNVAPRPLNPSQKELQLYPVATEIHGSQAPRSRLSPQADKLCNH